MQSLNLIALFLLLAATLSGQPPVEIKSTGKIIGTILEKGNGNPVEFATIQLFKTSGQTLVKGTVSDSKGSFTINDIPVGEYLLRYSFIGFENVEIPTVVVDSRHLKVDLGKLYISEANQKIDEVQVTGRKSTFINTIDRKTFNIGEDLMSKTGSLSDLLQNVPSLQVDIDGNVSLRGSENVTILINGKPSTMMNLNRAAALQQIPASSIDKIEVITNPSAKYKPDGTSGIINIVMKKNKGIGTSGNIIVNAGNNNRYNGNATINYNPGKLGLFANLGARKDDRQRINSITTQTFFNGAETSDIHNHSESHARPNNYIGTLGGEFKIDDKNRTGLSGNYNYRFQKQDDVSVYTNDSSSIRTEDFNRNRHLPELETDLEFTSFFQHNFGKEGHEVNLNYTRSFTKEYEDNYYTNIYRLPIVQTFYDNMFYHHRNNMSQFLAEYSNPFSENSKLEAGYELDYIHNDMDLHRDTTAMNQTIFAMDHSRSSRFIRSENTNVLYITYERDLGKFGFLIGMRGEHTNSTANLVSKNMEISNNYNRLYPSLHTSYKINNTHELQINYSHRIRRPEDEQLNPFPEYQDLRNVRAGNPYLKPEDIHSIELGYQIKKNVTTFLSTAYCRFNYNGITSITKISGDTLISTLHNLSKSTSAGLELIFSTSLGKLAIINLSSNTFYNKIDASALGYSNNKANVSMMANANVGFNLTKSTVWQFTSSYTGEQLTPQGKRLPSFVLNSGFKQEVFKKKAALILTVYGCVKFSSK